MHSLGKIDTPASGPASEPNRSAIQIRSGMACGPGGLAAGLTVEMRLSVAASATGGPGVLDRSAANIFSGSVRAIDPEA